MSRIRILLCASLACSALACGTVGAGQAQASTGQKLYFEAPADLLNPSTRPHALVQLQALGVRALRVELNWYTVAPSPTSATKPSFDATNPAAAIDTTANLQSMPIERITARRTCEPVKPACESNVIGPSGYALTRRGAVCIVGQHVRMNNRSRVRGTAAGCSVCRGRRAGRRSRRG